MPDSILKNNNITIFYHLARELYSACVLRLAW